MQCGTSTSSSFTQTVSYLCRKGPTCGCAHSLLRASLQTHNYELSALWTKQCTMQHHTHTHSLTHLRLFKPKYHCDHEDKQIKQQRDAALPLPQPSLPPVPCRGALIFNSNCHPPTLSLGGRVAPRGDKRLLGRYEGSAVEVAQPLGVHTFITTS